MTTRATIGKRLICFLLAILMIFSQMPTGIISVEAETTYSVTIDSTIQNGTISIAKVGETSYSEVKTTAQAEQGTAVTLTVTPAEGYAVSWIKANEDEVTADNEGVYSFTMPEKDVTVTAEFKKTYTVTIADDIKNGTVSVKDHTETPAIAAVGDTVTLTVTPNDGYVVSDVNVTIDKTEEKVEVTEQGDDKYTFTMPEKDVTVMAEFQLPLLGANVPQESVSYRYPVYNQTTGTPYAQASSGIKEWLSGSVTDYTIVSNTSEAVTWSAGWYVVKGEITITNTITCSGAVHLILKDGCKLTASSGINVAEGNSLVIYSETESGTGELSASGSDSQAGIGGGSNQNSGCITINGGKVTATCSRYAAGIGGGKHGGGSDITINGGNVEAVSNTEGAGIGGGMSGGASNITINGGTVSATGAFLSAGIGASSVNASNITITGGTVTAAGGKYSAGIGGGGINQFGDASDITISGGTVTATGGIGGTGIGGGKNSAGSNITISGGTVTVTGGQAEIAYDGIGCGSGAGIGGGGGSNNEWGATTSKNGGTGSGITISGGTVTATGGSGASNRGSGAGIGGGGSGGGGNGGTGSDITISGGTVTASGGSDNSGGGSGIGGGGGGKNNNGTGNGGTASNITISGGTVTASGGSDKGAGIGGGAGGEGGAAGGASSITAKASLMVYAGTSENPTTEICTDRTDDKDIAADISINRYVDIKPCIAKIEAVRYPSVQAAIDAATENQTVQMIADATENVKVASDDNISLDLNGYVLKSVADGKPVISIENDGTNYGNLTVTDNSTDTRTHYFNYVKNGAWTLKDDATEDAKKAAIDVSAITSETADGALIKVVGGCITGGNNTVTGGGGVENYGTFNFVSGNIVGNTAGTNGGGIWSQYKAEIFGGNIMGNTAQNGGGVWYASDPYVLTLTISGGNILYNTAVKNDDYSGKGGGVCNDWGNLNVSGGIISGNSAATGGGVFNAQGNAAMQISGGTMTMTGGSITGNKADTGGGATFGEAIILSGTAKITGNTKSDGTTVNNLYLPSGKTVTVSTTTVLAEGAEIGVTTEKAPTTGSPVAITGTNGSDYSSFFTSDNTNYSITNSTNNIVQLVDHQHSWEYTLSADNKTISAECKGIGTCTYTGTDKSLTIQAPASTTYDGSSHEASFTTTSFLGSTTLPNISYEYKSAEGGTYAATTDIIKAGYYKASFTVGSGTDAKTAYVEYEVKKVQLTVTGTTADSKTYNGNVSANATVGTVAGKVGTDDVTVEIDAANFADKNAGSGKGVTVSYKLTGDDAGNYTAPENDLTTADISPKQLSISTEEGEKTTVKEKVYDGTTDAEATIGTVVGIETGDDVTVAVQSAAFENKNVGENKTVTVVYEISGDDVGNYTKPDDGSVSANITKRPVTLTSESATKVYDGTALTNSTVTQSNFVDGESAKCTMTGTQTDAGSSDNSFTYVAGENTDLNNYNVQTKFGTLTVNAKSIEEAAVTGIETSYIYTGSEIKPEVTKVEIDGLEVPSDHYTVTYPSAGDYQSVGTGYEVKIEGKGNFTGSETKTFEIKPKSIEGAAVTGVETSYTYTGSEIKPTVTKVAIDGLEVPSDNYTVTYPSTGDYRSVGTGYEVKITASGNFTGSVTKSFEIKPKTTALSVDSIINQTYCGLAIEPTVTVKDTAGSELTKDTDYIVEYSDNLNAGTAKVTITGINGCATLSAEKTFTIEKRKISFTGRSGSKVYNGSEQKVEGFDIGETGLVEGHTSNVSASASGTVKGEYTGTITAKENIVIKDADQNDVTANYDITAANAGKLTITAITTPITITAKSNTKTYDGQPLTESGYDYTENVLVEGDVLSAAVEGTITNAGTVDNIVTSYQVKRGETDVTNCYTFAASAKGTLSISKRSVSLYSESASKDYDGTALTAPTVYADSEKTAVDSVFANEVEDLTATGTITNVSDSPVDNPISYNFKAGFTADNYQISKTEGQLTNTQNGSMTVAGTNYQGVYDGQAHGVAAVPTVTEGTTVEYSTDGGTTWSADFPTITNVGKTEVKVKAENSNYKTATCTYTLEMAKRSVTLTSASDSKTYDGTALTNNTVTQSNFVDGESAACTVTGTQTDAGSSDNSFTYTAGQNTDLNNYDVRTNFGKLTVNVRPVILVSLSATKVYDSTALTSAEVYGSAEKGAVDSVFAGEVKDLKATGTVTDVSDSPVTNAITYAGKTGFKASNYSVEKTEGTLTVTPITTSITITANSSTKDYDSTALKDSGFTYTDKVLVSGDELSAVVEGSITDAGTAANKVTSYKVTRGEKDVTANYTFAESVWGTLSISKRSVSLYSGSASKVYDSTALTAPNVYADKDKKAVDSVFANEVENLTAKGTITNVAAEPVKNSISYTFKEGFKADNYEISKTEGQLTITKAEASIKIKPQNFKTDGTLSYTGTSQDLVRSGTADGGEMQYCLGTAEAAGTSWSAAVPQGKDGGDYYVWYRVKCDSNHKGDDEGYVYGTGPVKATIVQKHLVVFDTGDGTAVAAQKVENGKNVVRPESPTYDGFIFQGWYEDQDCTKVFDFSKKITAATTIYAKWKEKEVTRYTVTFDTQGGKFSDVQSTIQSVVEGSKATKPEDPKWEGYTFGGWYTTESCTIAYDFEQTVTSDKTLYAKWTEAKVNLSVDKEIIIDDSIDKALQKTVEKELADDSKTKVEKLAEAVKEEGKTAIIKKAEEKAKVEVPESSIVDIDITVNVTAKAADTSEKMEVVYDLTPVAKVSEVTTRGESETKKTIAENVPVGNEDLTGETFTIKVPTLGMKPEEILHKSIDKDGKEYVKDAYAVADTYDSTNQTVTVEVNSFSTLTLNGSRTYYEVKFDSNGHGTAPTKQVVAANTRATEPTALTAAGCTFGGWYKDKKCTQAYNFADYVEKDITLYAKWTKDTTYHFVAFDGNGDDVTGSMAEMAVQCGTSANLTANAFKKNGYTFDGWKDTNGNSYADQASFTAPDTQGTTTLTAQWKQDEYQIVFDSNGGSAVAGQTKHCGDKITKPTEPARENYVFDGWYTDAACTKAWNFDEDVLTAEMVKEDEGQKTVTLYAKWLKKVDICTIDTIADQTFTGKAIEPEITVKDDTTTLVKDQDYTVEYRDNLNAGTATVTITGIGDYTSSKTAEFKILPKSIEGAQVTLDTSVFIENGSTQTAKVKSVRLAGWDETITYIVSDNTAKAAGSYTLKVTGTDNYTGVVEVPFSVVARSAEDEEPISGKTPWKPFGQDGGTVTFETIPTTSDTPKTTINMTKTDLTAAIATAGDLESVSEGSTLDIWLEVTKNDDNVPSEVKQAIENVIGDKKVGCYLDASLFKKITSAAGTTLLDKTKITELNNGRSILIGVTVPEELIANNSDFGIARYHGTTAEVLESYYDAETKTLYFSTDKFSDYAIIMTPNAEASPNTGITSDSTTLPIAGILIALSALIGLGWILYKKMRNS